MRISRSRLGAAFAAVLAFATPVLAQQHCTLVRHCTTVETKIFGFVIDTETTCSSSIICHYHT
jgi:hypothetical protein